MIFPMSAWDLLKPNQTKKPKTFFFLTLSVYSYRLIFLYVPQIMLSDLTCTMGYLGSLCLLAQTADLDLPVSITPANNSLSCYINTFHLSCFSREL